MNQQANAGLIYKKTHEFTYLKLRHYYFQDLMLEMRNLRSKTLF